MSRLIVALLIGVLVGGLAVHFLAPPAQVGTGFADWNPAADVGRPQPREPVLVEPVRTVASSPVERTLESSEPDVLISAALRRHAEEGLRAGWKAVREDEIPDDDLAEGMKSFEKLVLGSPLGIGRSLGERRTKAEEALADAKSGGVFALLEKLDAGGVGPLPGLVRDPKQFEPLFARLLSEERRSGLANREHPDKDIEDGVTLTWPAGVFSLRNLMAEKKPFPRDVTIEGAGMNATLLVLGNALMGSRLRNFTIRDCTVHTNNNYLFDLRHVPAAIQFDRVRFVGFDMGAGASCLLGTDSLALWARNCRFEGGYGRSPQHGTLFDVRTDGLVARFDACHLSLLNLETDRIYSGATVLFSGCVLEQLFDNPLPGAEGRPGVLFDNCSITGFAGEMNAVPKLDLNDLFPSWRTRME